MAYRIGSFNMFKFSFRSDNEIRKDIKLIARIIYEQQFEIIALQEVFSKNAMDLLLKELVNIDGRESGMHQMPWVL